MTATAYRYPRITELQQIERDLVPVLTMDDPIFEIMPIREVNADRLQWDQEDDIIGLSQLRGLDGQPQNVRAVGSSRYEARPGVYGEFMTIDEEELTARAALGMNGQPVDVSDLVRMRQDQLLHRRINRIRYLGWKLVTTGSYLVTNRNGISHGDSYTLQTYDASTWATAASATPLADFRGAQQLSGGHGVDFGASATAYANRVTSNYLLANTNAADLGGKRTAGLSNVLSLGQVNEVQGLEDLPRIRVYDDGYKDANGVFQRFIPNGVVVIVGKRTGGATIMDFAYTRNANNPGSAPGPYTFVDDRTTGPAKIVPPTIFVHDGFNGGLRVYYPSAIVLMNVS